MEKQKDIKLEVHPALEGLEDSILFFLVSQNMMVMPLFQKLLIESHNGEMSGITTSADSGDFNSVKFKVEYVLDRFNKKVQLKEAGGKVECNIKELLIQQGRLTVIALFNFLESSKYNKEINKGELFRFVKHLRNGASHNNRFNFTTSEMDKLKSEEVCWRGKIINHALQKKKVFGSFIYLSDLVVLIGDISEELLRVDKKIGARK